MTVRSALYGRVPNILPDLNQVDAPNEESLDHPGLIRHTFRLREIAVGAMIAETALHRAQRALNTRTIPAGEREKYQPGDLVDFYRPPGSKDVSGISALQWNFGLLYCSFALRHGDLRCSALTRSILITTSNI